MKYLLMTLLMFFGSFAYAEILNFECTYGKAGGDKNSPISHSVDMTNKTWEKTDGGLTRIGAVTRIFDDVVASSNSISVKGQYTSYGSLAREAHVISRVDLSYSFKLEFHSEILGGWQAPNNYVGQCKIIDAPSVERAF